MRKVIIETPFAGHEEKNLQFLRACMHDALVNYGEASFPSHGLYTRPGVLNDSVREVADATVVYTNLGISRGMKYGIEHATKLGKPIVFRVLPEGILDAFSTRYW